MPNDLRERVAGYTWHHSMDLGDGVVTPGGKSPAICKTEADVIFDRLDLRGRTVGQSIPVRNGSFKVQVGAFAPVSLVMNVGE